jgi:hypothetical protein
MLLSKVESVDQRTRLGMRSRLSPTAGAVAHVRTSLGWPVQPGCYPTSTALGGVTMLFPGRRNLGVAWSRGELKNPPGEVAIPGNLAYLCAVISRGLGKIWLCFASCSPLVRSASFRFEHLLIS